MKNNKIMIFLLMILAIIFVGFTGSQDVKAASFSDNVKALTKKGGSALTGVAKTDAIPAAYGTFGFFKYTGDYKPIYAGVSPVPTAVKNAWGDYSKKDDTWTNMFVNGEHKPTLAKTDYSICVPHAALYNGQWIDIKGTVTGFAKSSYSGYEKANKNRKPIIGFTANKSTKRVYVEVQGVNYVTVKWAFTKYNGNNGKCTGAAVTVSGNTSYRDVDWQQGIRLTGSTNKGLYIFNKSNKLRYGNVTNGSGTSARHVFDKDNTDTTAANKNFAFTEVFTGQTMTRTYTFVRNKDNKARGGIANEYVSYNAITPPNPTKTQSSATLKEGANQTYTIEQKIPNQDSSHYHTKVVLKDVLDPCFDMSATSAKIVSPNGGSASYFTIAKSGQTVTATATAAALKNENFYGKTYQLVITTKIKNGYDFSKYPKEGNAYKVNDQGSSIINSTTRNTGTVTAKYTPPTCKYQYSKYYDSKGNIVSEATYKLDLTCNPPKCEIRGGKYYNNESKEVTFEEYNVQCEHSCKIENGKYITKDGKDATANKDDWYDSCKEPSDMTDPAKAVNATTIRFEKEFNYGIIFSIPHVTKSYFYKSFEVSDVLENPLKITDKSKIKVFGTKVNPADKSFEEDMDAALSWTDETSKFETDVNGQKVTVKLKDPSDSSFYGTRDYDNNDTEIMKAYIVILPVALDKDKASISAMSKYLKDGKYVIPDVATVTITDKDSKNIEKKTNNVDVYYEEDLPAQKSVNMENVTAVQKGGGSYIYTIEKSVVNYGPEQYYKSFVMKDTFEDCISIKGVSDIKVLNEEDKNVTEWFNISLSGQKLVVSLKDANNNENFYGHKYRFIVIAGIKQNADLDKYESDGRYVIPNKASFIYDDDIVNETNKVNVIVDIPMVVKKVKAPNTASPAMIGAILAGVVAVVVAGYLLISYTGFNPFAKFKK